MVELEDVMGHPVWVNPAHIVQAKAIQGQKQTELQFVSGSSLRGQGELAETMVKVG